jgi:hypothetical protein
MPYNVVYLTLTFVLAVILIFIVAVYIAPEIFKIIAGAQKRVSPITQNESEIVTENFTALGIIDTDLPEIKIYKLFRNFDPSFVNETPNVNQILYNSFILNLTDNNGNNHVYGYSDMLYNNLTLGVKDFSKINNYYEIVDAINLNQATLNCVSQYDGTINYNTECWNQAAFNSLNIPCKILLHGDASNQFNGKIKIRVGWKDKNMQPHGREVINVLIALCDG